MTRKAFEKLSQIQQSVMEVVWELGEATVAQARDRLSPDRSIPYTTVMSAMRRLEESGWLHHRTEGKTYIYQPKRTREEEGVRSVRKFIDQAFGGNPLLLFQHFVNGQELSDEELAELRQFINDEWEERRNGDSVPN